jgi:hypothetical protein
MKDLPITARMCTRVALIPMVITRPGLCTTTQAITCAHRVITRRRLITTAHRQGPVTARVAGVVLAGVGIVRHRPHRGAALAVATGMATVTMATMAAEAMAAVAANTWVTPILRHCHDVGAGSARQADTAVCQALRGEAFAAAGRSYRGPSDLKVTDTIESPTVAATGIAFNNPTGPPADGGLPRLC